MKKKDIIKKILEMCDEVDCAKPFDDNTTAIASDARFEFAYDISSLILDNMKDKKDS